jgi:hypothetical protein
MISLGSKECKLYLKDCDFSINDPIRAKFGCSMIKNRPELALS